MLNVGWVSSNLFIYGLVITDGSKDGFCQTLSDIQDWATWELQAGCSIEGYSPTQGWNTLQAQTTESIKPKVD